MKVNADDVGQCAQQSVVLSVGQPSSLFPGKRQERILRRRADNYNYEQLVMSKQRAPLINLSLSLSLLFSPLFLPYLSPLFISLLSRCLCRSHRRVPPAVRQIRPWPPEYPFLHAWQVPPLLGKHGIFQFTRVHRRCGSSTRFRPLATSSVLLAASVPPARKISTHLVAFGRSCVYRGQPSTITLLFRGRKLNHPLLLLILSLLSLPSFAFSSLMDRRSQGPQAEIKIFFS